MKTIYLHENFDIANLMGSDWKQIEISKGLRYPYIRVHVNVVIECLNLLENIDTVEGIVYCLRLDVCINSLYTSPF